MIQKDGLLKKFRMISQDVFFDHTSRLRTGSPPAFITAGVLSSNCITEGSKFHFYQMMLSSGLSGEPSLCMVYPGKNRENKTGGERCHNHVGAPENRISGSGRTRPDAPGQRHLCRNLDRWSPLTKKNLPYIGDINNQAFYGSELRTWRLACKSYPSA